MRIIDADEIRKKAVPHTRGEYGYNANIRKWAVLVGDIDDAPTIDPESLRPEGWWEDEYGGEYVNPRYRCSVCKEKAFFKIDRDCLGGWHEVQALTPSCPICGAKMKGVK